MSPKICLGISHLRGGERKGITKVHTFDLTSFPVTVGKAEISDIIIPREYYFGSRKHAIIRPLRSGIAGYKDISTAGTSYVFSGGLHRIRGQEFTLRKGDRLRITPLDDTGYGLELEVLDLE